MPTISRSQKKAVSRILKQLCKCKTEIISAERCQRLGIEIVPVSLEDSADPESRPSYFRATPLNYMEEHPINQTYLQSLMKESPSLLTLREYDPAVANNYGLTATLNDRLAAAPDARVKQITRILDHHISHVVRDNMPSGSYALGHDREWSYACDSNVNPLAEVYYAPEDVDVHTEHPTVMIFEVDNHRMPHVTMVMEHNTRQEVNEKDFYVLELVSILRAMLLRYSQPEFEQYEVIPVLLLSFMSPQNGRILEASLDRSRLIVRKSPMYSFKINRDAPFELFSRWLLADPVGMASITGETSESTGERARETIGKSVGS